MTTSSATSIQIGVTSDIASKLVECLPWYDALCLTTTGQSVSTDLVLDDDTFKKNSEKYGTACANLKSNYSCGTACDIRNQVLIEQMLPLVYDIWPTQSIWDNIKTSFSSIANKTADWFKNTFSRRLIGTSTYPAKLTVNSTGANLVTLGGNSGQDLKEANLSILSCALIGFILLLF